MIIIFLALILCITNSKIVYAEFASNKSAARGWWFYQINDSVKINKKFSMLETSNPAKKVNRPDDKPMSIDCSKPEQWVIACGFVEPDNYNFEQKQYHALIRNFAMNPNDLTAVHQFQKFNYWAVSHAMAASYSWQYNLAQNPELDGTVANPVSQFGNLMVMNIEKSARKDFFKLLAKSSLLVYFSRSHCQYCLAESTIIQSLGKTTGIPIWNASLDEAHLSGFQYYLTAPATVIPAQILQVNIVPALFLYLAPNESKAGAKWIRIATGITTEDVIEERLINFVESYRHALIQGASQGQRQIAPDFSILHENMLAGGKS